MPKKEGRSGKPGNETSYKPIHINTPRPDLLKPGTVRSNLSVTHVLGRVSVPPKEKKFNYRKKRGVR